MMTARRREITDCTDRYRSLRNFYLADRRRRASREDDIGLWWRVGVHGPLYRAAWVRDTGELYVTRLGGRHHDVGEGLVLGCAEDRGQLEEALQGWQGACPTPDSMAGLRRRAAGLGAGRSRHPGPRRSPRGVGARDPPGRRGRAPRGGREGGRGSVGAR